MNLHFADVLYARKMTHVECDDDCNELTVFYSDGNSEKYGKTDSWYEIKPFSRLLHYPTTKKLDKLQLLAKNNGGHYRLEV